MKYANGNLYICGKQVRVFICAKTYKRMVELGYDCGLNMSYFNNYWSKYGNDKMRNTAQDKEGIWIEQGKDYSGEYKPLSEVLKNQGGIGE